MDDLTTYNAFEPFRRYVENSGSRFFTGGHFIRFRFDNDYGASIIRGPGSYGYEDGLFELAVIHFDAGGNFGLVYDTPRTENVIGNLTKAEVVDYLHKIMLLPPRSE